MNTLKVLKGFLVLAVAFFGFVPSAATSASNVGTMAGVAYAPCLETVTSGGNLPSGQTLSIDCSAAEASQYSQMTGTYLPGMSGGDFIGTQDSVYSHMTGTYLPGMSGGLSLTVATSP